jgi:hypothetical protein
VSCKIWTHVRTNAEMAVTAAMLRALVHVQCVWVGQLHQVDHLAARQPTASFNDVCLNHVEFTSGSANHTLDMIKYYYYQKYDTHFLPQEARYELQVKAADILPLVRLARSKQDPVNRGHGAQYLYCPLLAGAHIKDEIETSSRSARTAAVQVGRGEHDGGVPADPEPGTAVRQLAVWTRRVQFQPQDAHVELQGALQVLHKQAHMVQPIVHDAPWQQCQNGLTKLNDT